MNVATISLLVDMRIFVTHSCEGKALGKQTIQALGVGNSIVGEAGPIVGSYCYDCVCNHVGASLRIPYCAGCCLYRGRTLFNIAESAILLTMLSAILPAILPAILLISNIAGNIASNIADNIASNIADFTAILLAILLISNIADNIAGNIARNIASNIADSAILN